MIEVEADAFDAVSAAPLLHVSVPTVEVRQAGGLLTATRRVVLAEGLGSANRIAAGVDDALPAVRLFVQPAEEEK